MGKQKKRNRNTSGPSIRKELRSPQLSTVEPKLWYHTFAWPIVLVLCVITFFLLIHGSNYERRTRFLTFDESVYIRLGFQLKNGEKYNTQKLYEEKKKSRALPSYLNRPVFKHPPMYPWLVSMSYAALEQKSNYKYEELYGAASKVSNIMGCLLILLVFMFAKKYYGYSTGFLAAFLMAIDLNMTLSSQKVWIASSLSVFMFASLYLLYKACEEHKGYFYLAGIFFGFAMLTKYTAVLVIPILLTYLLIYHRDMFFKKELYIFFAISAVVFFPWAKHNMSVYGMDAFKMMVLKQTSGPVKMLNFAIIAGVIIGIITAAAYYYKVKLANNDDKQKDNAPRNNFLPVAGFIAIALFIGFMFLHKPFLVSILKTLNWSEIPNAGWDMSIYKKEPWYFYLKQHIEYSPIYLFLFVAFIRAPFGQKQDVFLFLCCFWVLLFAIVWKNYQGRYALSFVPPAIILMSSTITLIFKYISKQRNALGYISLGVAYMVMAYFVLKAFKVYHAIALNGNVAYF